MKAYTSLPVGPDQVLQKKPLYSCVPDFEAVAGGKVSCNVSSHLFFFQRQRKIQKERLLNDFSAALNSFQKIQRQAANREREFVARVRASSRVSVRNQLYRTRAHTKAQNPLQCLHFLLTGRTT